MNKIIKELAKYLDEIAISRIRMVTSVKGDIVIVLTLADIIRKHDCDIEEEKVVSKLIFDLCKKYFNQRQTKQ